MHEVTAEAFAAHLQALLPANARCLAVACSGGPDSMALAFCAHRWAKANGGSVVALIVDHLLRSESSEEAEQVKQRLAALGIQTEILRWEHETVTSRVHILARAARYDLLTSTCRTKNIDALLIAHQREDQAETILMRLAKGSGFDGLAGIDPVSTRDGVVLVRPLLAFSKEQLIATCETAGISFVTDPSNASAKYARGRLRKVLPLLASEGLTIDRLIDLGERAREAKDAIDQVTDAFLHAHAHLDQSGVLHFKREAFAALPNAIAGRAVGRALNYLHPELYAPERALFAPILAELRAKEAMPTRSFHGCLLSKTETEIKMIREWAAIKECQTIQPGQTLVWDNRWRVTLAAQALAAYEVRALGVQPYHLLDTLAPRLRHDVPQGRARAALPALWQGDKPALIPVFNNASAPAPAKATLLPFFA